MPSIKYKKKTYAGATFPVLEMTKAEYDALSEAKKMDGTVYMITDDTGGWEAEKSVYDNSESGLTATNVQDAIDTINAAVNALDDIKGFTYNGSPHNRRLCIRTVIKTLDHNSTTSVSFTAFPNNVLFAIPFCNQLGFSSPSTISIGNLSNGSLSAKQANGASAGMSVGFVIFGF